MNMMATQSSLQDCYFYFYSSCTKGDECPFRHCELALGTETVCSLWREGRCFRSNCKFRHMESRIKRAMIPCYWENQPGGCRKPHCVFMHRRLRNGVQVIKDTPRLILPTSAGKTSPNHPDSNETPNMPNKVVLMETTVESDVAPDPSLATVPPLVLKFDEESDTESVSSTPVKQGDKKAALSKNNASVKTSGSDFGIKTLEQIRMEKIHKESDSYYGAAYTSAPQLVDQLYPPQTEFLALPKDLPLDESVPAPIIEPTNSGADEETYLRGRLFNRRNVSLSKVNHVTRLINFKKQNTNQVEVVSKRLDFKIKTLEEIRREKENKQSKPEVAVKNSLHVLSSLDEKPINSKREKTVKLKINRKPRGFYSTPAVLKQDASAPNMTDMTSTYLVSNGIKKRMSTSSEETSEIPALKKNSSDSTGKRKNDDDSPTSVSKIIKLDTTSNGNCEQVCQDVIACVEGTAENNVQTVSYPGIRVSSPTNETSEPSTQVHTSSSLNLKQSEIIASENSVTFVEMNGVFTPAFTSLLPSSSLPKSSHMSDEKTVNASAENEHILRDEISDKTPNSSALSSTIKSDPSNDNGANKGRYNIIDRSMSVDDDLDEFLGGDDMSNYEVDATPNDDILLEIEEFLES